MKKIEIKMLLYILTKKILKLKKLVKSIWYHIVLQNGVVV
jgi:hypothetical protein